LSREQVRKYFEVRLYSLALAAAVIFIFCVLLLFLFVWRGQYVYAVVVAAVAATVAVAAMKLWQYAGTYRHLEIERPPTDVDQEDVIQGI
jgi:membrane protein YdbS with pleckstrin-like domain